MEYCKILNSRHQISRFQVSEMGDLNTETLVIAFCYLDFSDIPALH